MRRVLVRNTALWLLNTRLRVLVVAWATLTVACAATLPRLLDSRGSFSSTGSMPADSQLLADLGLSGQGRVSVSVRHKRTNTWTLWPAVETSAAARLHMFNAIGERLSPTEGIQLPEATRARLLEQVRVSHETPADPRAMTYVQLRTAQMRDGITLTESDTDRLAWWYWSLPILAALLFVSVVLACRVAEAWYVGSMMPTRTKTVGLTA